MPVTNIESNPYARIGAVDPNFTAAALPQLDNYLYKGSQFNNYNSVDRLGGFLINTLAGIHAKIEVPALRARLQTPIARATVDSYIDHLKADGDGIVAAIGSLRNTKTGSERAAYANEFSRAAGRYSILATTANYNFAFVHTSAKQAVYTVGYHNQQTDFWHGCSKFFWFRAEKHFQIQAATASRYITEAVEDIYNKQVEVSNTRETRIGTWTLRGQDSNTGSIDFKLPEAFSLQSKDIQIAALQTLLCQSVNLYLQAKQELKIASERNIQISAAQIFLTSNLFATKINKLPTNPIVKPLVQIETLPPYVRTAATANQPLPVVAQGTQLISQPPI